MAYGCGSCLHCRINRRRVWAHRIMLESYSHEENAFLTLTYEDKFLPPDGSLVPKDLQDFMKRLRKDYQDERKIRFFGVGEYGDKSWRPHYHVMLFGFPTCLGMRSNPNKKTGRCCAVCDRVRELWGKGRIELALVTPASANYIAGYTTKKLTDPRDPRLEGRLPEFARMSLRPGIGALSVPDLASVVLTHDAFENGDVPFALGHGRKSKLPLGRYLVKQLRLQTGLDPKISQRAYDAYQAKMLSLREAAKSSAENPSFAGQLKKSTEQKRRGVVARRKIYEKGRSL